MALHVPKSSGYASMMKEGSRYFSGLDEAVFRNINACKQLSETTRSAYGPKGLNKMVINHLQKLFVTNDAATIIRELDVEHPAAKIVVMASQMQEQEIGDGTNFVLVFTGALLEHAEELLRMGLTPTDVAEGYELALKKALDVLPELTCYEITDYRNEVEAVKSIKTSIMSKQYGNEDFLAKVVAQACVSILPEKSTFNVDNIRVCKILGSGFLNSTVMQGMVFKRSAEGSIEKVDKGKIAVFTGAFDILQTETKGTVLIHTAEELLKYSKGEESLLEKQVKELSEAGVTVVVSGGKIGDLSLHFLNKYNIMAVRLQSKFDIRRLCKTVGATALPKITTPTPEELGHCDHVFADEVGGTSVIVFKQDGKESSISTVIIRGSTDSVMDDIERAVDDGVNNFKAITKDGRLLPGAGATEIELAKQISVFAKTRPGLEQYAIEKFAQALESLPKALAENAGMKGNEVVAKLYTAHQEGNAHIGIDIEGEGAAVKDVVEAGLLDAYLNKHWAIKYSTSAACTILKVDQIIMAKASGGPKPKKNDQWDED